jgi:quinol monooxygenase YgiN
MFGTIALMKPKAGTEAQLDALFNQWWDERRPKIKGAVSSTVYRNVSNPAEIMLAVVFDSKENYEANANDPEQGEWYQKLVALLEGEPRWIDGDVLNHKHV